MESSAEIRIVSDDGMSDLETINNRLRTLVLTPEGAMIGNRGFGISFDMVGMNPKQAVNFLAMELQKKLPVYIPEIALSDVDWAANDKGETVITIRIRKANS